jgi:predicted AlkP superfamily pyrophosphatase or phosphodiesterase
MGLGADVIANFQDQVPTLARAISKGIVKTSFPTTTATSLATLTTGALPGAHMECWVTPFEFHVVVEEFLTH